MILCVLCDKNSFGGLRPRSSKVFGCVDLVSAIQTFGSPDGELRNSAPDGRFITAFHFLAAAMAAKWQ